VKTIGIHAAIFRQSGLTERDERTISNIERFGCEVVQVKRSSAGPRWLYTWGIIRKWVRHPMDRAIWYYGGGAFAVLQAVYPDRDNRFPEHPDHGSNFRQPLLQPDAPETALERDFRSSADPDSSLFKSDVS
jgi:hypothetical protein